MTQKLEEKLEKIFHKFVVKYWGKIGCRGKLYRISDLVDKNTDRDIYETLFWLDIEYVFIEVGIGEVDKLIYLSNEYEKMYSNDSGM